MWRGVYYESMNTVSEKFGTLFTQVFITPYVDAGLGRRLPALDQLHR